jgi:hypothetical protein
MNECADEKKKQVQLKGWRFEHEPYHSPYKLRELISFVTNYQQTNQKQSGCNKNLGAH